MKSHFRRTLALILPGLWLLPGLLSPCLAEDASPLPTDAGVARASFTTEIVAREPVDQVVTLPNSYSEVYYFTDLRNLEGRTITHQWEFEGQVISKVNFEVAGPRWRVHSKKTLDPSMTGKWTVMVLDESGWPLHASMFQYEEAIGP